MVIQDSFGTDPSQTGRTGPAKQMVKHRFDLVVGRRSRRDPSGVESLSRAPEKFAPGLTPARLSSLVHRLWSSLKDRF
jgi:hypothetical protein